MKYKKLVFCCLIAFFVKQAVFSQSADAYTSDTIEVNGTKLYVKSIGVGEPLLFIHGGPGLSHDYFLPHVLPLSDHFKLIFYDQRATGRSDINVDTAQMTLKNFVADIEGIRKYFHIKKLNIVGHSWGGFLENLYAIKHKSRVRSLVYWDATPLSSHLRDVMFNNQKAAVNKEDISNSLKIMRTPEFKRGDPEEIERLYKAIFKPSVFVQRLVYKMHFYFNSNYSKSQYLLGFLNNSMKKFDYYSKLHKVKAPALIFQGANDPMPIESSEELNRQLRNSELIILKNCGHFPFLEQPKEVFSKMREFYAKLDAKKK